MNAARILWVKLNRGKMTMIRIRFVSKRTFNFLVITSILVFVAWGDLFLPKPLNSYSRNTRNKINSVLLGAFPKEDMQETRPSGKREKELRKLRLEPPSEQKSNSSSTN